MENLYISSPETDRLKTSLVSTAAWIWPLAGRCVRTNIHLKDLPVKPVLAHLYLMLYYYDI